MREISNELTVATTTVFNIINKYGESASIDVCRKSSCPPKAVSQRSAFNSNILCRTSKPRKVVKCLENRWVIAITRVGRMIEVSDLTLTKRVIKCNVDVVMRFAHSFIFFMSHNYVHKKSTQKYTQLQSKRQERCRQTSEKMVVLFL
ncbi:unnamed protein product [Diabrotica balteata]|uniref:Uncharacterized protein n=1 Tax=Diabrotica balteata TaxID=107213 RepID=A0A9N9SPQ4_DIABA|nr:unnamed protein product [Diabrotica balteata]